MENTGSIDACNSIEFSIPSLYPQSSKNLTGLSGFLLL
ncbi:hypothetical protein QSI_2253 [Clostridioides difficile P28]|nr:hypothetical protein QSI_2253 [Clostridioides difficile P28]